ncbi:MAG TPA: hypothetical protein VIO84_03980 [Candidatus Dormibacteraeota bacterium]|jgi:hypothetical protein
MPAKKSESQIKKMVEAEAKGKGAKKAGKDRNRSATSELDDRKSKYQTIKLTGD